MLTFLSAALISGEIRAELPLAPVDPLSRYLMDVGDGTLALPIRDPSCPADWIDHTRPWRTLLIAVDERAQIVWAGIPTDRVRDPADPVVQMPCVTVEGYLDRRYVPDLSFVGRDQTRYIARGLVETTNERGIGLEYDTPASGVFRNRDYYDDESATVLQRLQELSAVINGPEWTIDVEWSNEGQTRVRKVFRTGHPHLGYVTDRPDAVFELPGGVESAEYTEGWTSDKAATYVVATGDGEGESKVISAPVIDTEREGADWPRLELRRSFSSVTRQATINEHAERTAAEVFGGEHLVALTHRAYEPPLFGEWGLGDSVGLSIHTEVVDLEEVWRVVGWSLSDTDGSIEPYIARVRTSL